MRDGFIKIAAVTPAVEIADAAANARAIVGGAVRAEGMGAKLVIFPELSVCGYTAGDLFLQEKLLSGCVDALFYIAENTEKLNAVIAVGAPLVSGGKLYNCAFIITGGRIIAAYPKTYIPSYGEFYETRHFTAFDGKTREVTLTRGGRTFTFPMGYVVCKCISVPALTLAAEICEDMWAPEPPSARLAKAGAHVIFNLSASDEVIGKADYRRTLVRAQSGRCECVYAYSGAGGGESTTDAVYGGHKLIAESGNILAEGSSLFDGKDILITEADVQSVAAERRRRNTFETEEGETVYFDLKEERTVLENRYIPAMPFVPEDGDAREDRCAEILTMQTEGLATRMKRAGAKTLVVGISGGLDSALALAVACSAADKAWGSRENVIAVTMPCFGTTRRTKSNAVKLTKALGATLKEVNIKKAVLRHFADIGHDEDVHDVTYENSQARERTQVLMDIANQTGGLVVGTGDLSELALGWATYNGDHMSMYGVNAGVPKTLVKHLVNYYALTCGNAAVKRALLSICDTPISPELLPPKDGEIAQRTEDIVGPYELHDFILYNVVRRGFTPSKVFRLAMHAFVKGEDGSERNKGFTAEDIYKWTDNFYRRFFAQQFKRSCLPDGPKVGSVTLSPRADWRMPSDASSAMWRQELKAAYLAYSAK